MTFPPFLAMLQTMGYPGGKNGAGVYQSLINLMPPHEVYIEPFLGGAAVMRLKLLASLNIGVDLDPAALCSAMLPAGSVELASSAEAGGNGDSGDRGPGGLARTDERRRRRRSPDCAIQASNGKSGDVRSRFRYIQGDGIEFLETYPFTGRELVYCDPPYLMSTRSGRKLYQYEMSAIDHRRLLRVVMCIPCRVMISGYSSVLYAKTLKGWNVAAFTATTRGGTERAEWVWYNYPPPTELHDYRYLGHGFRERERIKRQKARWIKRLERMPTLQRQALLSAIADLRI